MGCIAFYVDTDGRKEYGSQMCYVNQQKCQAKADLFGAIVIELLPPKEKK